MIKRCWGNRKPKRACLIKVGPRKFDESAGFRPFRVVEKVQSIFSVLVLQHKVQALPLLIFLALPLQVSLHFGVHGLFDASLFAALAKRFINLFRVRGKLSRCLDKSARR